VRLAPTGNLTPRLGVLPVYSVTTSRARLWVTPMPLGTESTWKAAQEPERVETSENQGFVHCFLCLGNGGPPLSYTFPDRVKEGSVARYSGMKTYIWYWVGGGYNSCPAASKAEALQKAQEMGAPHPSGFRGLTVAAGTLHVAKRGELEAIDREYASLFN